MKTCIRHPFPLPVLIATLGLMPAGRVTAQTFTTVHNFTGGNDGANPEAGLLFSGNTLYGTASGGGISGNGTVFAINSDGTGFKVLHSFTGDSDGKDPQTGLILSGNTLYGVTTEGGSTDNGTVFAVNTDGKGFTVLHTFTGAFGTNTNTDGALPMAGLVLSGNTLYGTAGSGGSATNGTVFAVNIDGTGFKVLHDFTAISDSDGTNKD